ncbi:MAG: SDR family NAD(P)-dependent oxidoreductase [Sporichthyaceae bacterium]
MRRILITGAASGLGKALASAAARDGAWVLLTDVDPQAGELARLELAELLRETGGDPQRVAFLPLDVRSEEAWIAAREWVQREWSGLDVLVNNAGVAVGGPIADTPLADWDWIIDINLKGVVRGVHTFLPVFALQGGGHVVNIASLAGIANAPSMSAYNVTKAGVISLSETMRFELAGKGVRTTVVCPSFFATNIHTNMRSSDPMFEVIATKMVTGEGIPGPKLTADDVARKVLRAVDRHTFWCLPHLEGRAIWMLKRYAPPVYTAGAQFGNRLLDRLAAKAPAAERKGAPTPR